MSRRSRLRHSSDTVPAWIWWTIGGFIAIILFISALYTPHLFTAGILPLAFVIVGTLTYFLPSFVARNGKHPNAIFYANLLLGWTGIGWVGVLIWAIVEHENHKAAIEAARIK